MNNGGVTTEGVLIGLALGVAAGMAIQVTMRAFRDVKTAREFAAEKKRQAWRTTPRFAIWVFVGVCAAIAALRLMTGAR